MAPLDTPEEDFELLLELTELLLPELIVLPAVPEDELPLDPEELGEDLLELLLPAAAELEPAPEVEAPAFEELAEAAELLPVLPPPPVAPADPPFEEAFAPVVGAVLPVPAAAPFVDVPNEPVRAVVLGAGVLGADVPGFDAPGAAVDVWPAEVLVPAALVLLLPGAGATAAPLDDDNTWCAIMPAATADERP